MDEHEHDDVDINSLKWFHTDEGKDWLKHAPLGDLVGRQDFLLFRENPRRADAQEQYNIIERALCPNHPMRNS
jgi:hypothetical protein